MTNKNPLDNTAVLAKTYREVLTELLTDDWNLRRTVMRAKDTDTFGAHFSFNVEFPMELAKQILDDLPPMS